MSSTRISFMLLLICSIMISMVFASSPYGSYGSSSMYMSPIYSRQLNLHPGIYGTSYGLNPSSYGYHQIMNGGGGGGSRNGQGFVGNPGIGIRQSSETLANVYPQMSYGSSSTSYLSPMQSYATYSSPISSLYGGGGVGISRSSYGSPYISSPYIG
ncbi:hypothetical protein DERP_013793 [Dermatophagoides pteronyssinus]|uniref:Shematrin-like protein 1 n=1 Tax=Dermatophagoides pteronyssinus TaxID=6956 RepID=A0ABQ8JD17_DERPT|nr:hypothetical protein DERP_013793 [Dermatophagoides pteronyssinus]